MAKYRKFNRTDLTKTQMQERKRRLMMRDRINPLKKIWDWLKMVAKLPKLLPRRHQDDPDSPQHVPTALEKEIGSEIHKRQAGEGRSVDTRHGGPNMPKRQDCPVCNRMVKRTGKTMGGANYKCCKHGDFFVRAPRL